MSEQGICFVIMGYGVKTDYATGRELDLDKTYKNVIKPAVEELGLKCIRADEIRHSGTIDVPMYEHLINANVVIADLSTSNSNAFYELGVRHALRPFTTIAIAESELAPPFDVNHTVIRQYEHLGKDIGYDEVMRFRLELKETIRTVLEDPRTDSPVYTFLSNLVPPILEQEQKSSSNETNDDNTLSSILESAKGALDKDDFMTAKVLFGHALTIDTKSSYIIQKLALATYKSKFPNHVESLKQALSILEPLNLDSTTDPETLGLAGAIHKRLWEELNDIPHLDKSIWYYEKGFYIKNDYYNGINLAYLLNVRSSLTSGDESVTDYTLANRIRKQVVSICKGLLNHQFSNRSDQYWIFATLEEAYFGLGDIENYQDAKAQSISLSRQNWERETTESQISKLEILLKEK
ncbi:TRAFs-binding domain-containing protein [Bacillota bacterium Lsc_1132]